MVFYSTNGDQELAVFKIKTLLQLLSKHRVNKRNMVFFSTHRASSICCHNIIQTGGAWFSVFQIDTKLQLLLYHHDDRRYMVFYSNICTYRTNRDHAPAIVITSWQQGSILSLSYGTNGDNAPAVVITPRPKSCIFFYSTNTYHAPAVS